jgi:hypothetical protein
MLKTLLNLAKEHWISILLAVVAAILLFIPATYFGLISYMVKNSIIMLNISEMTDEMIQASVGLYNGMVIEIVPIWVNFLLAFMGIFSLYISVYLIKYKDNKKAILRKSYWIKYN